MKRSPSVLKRTRQNETRRVRNRSARSELRSQIKKLRRALDAKEVARARELLPETVSLIDQLVKKGIIHENTGSRYKSRLGSRMAVTSGRN